LIMILLVTVSHALIASAEADKLPVRAA